LESTKFNVIMKNVILILLMFIGLNAMAQGGSLNLSKEGGAQIVFVTETLDYGTILKGADGNREFVFTNTGNEPLIISSCKGSCGCTVPKCPTEPILPGETSKIKVKYDTNRLGKVTKMVTVTSNAGEPTKTIKIVVNVIDGEGQAPE
jgi:hypothetical protein